MLRVGLIGCGGMGTTHSGCYGAMQESVVLAAVADLEEEKAKSVSARFGSEIYSSGMELIENADVDVVDICVPTYLHAELAIAAMKKGKVDMAIGDNLPLGYVPCTTYWVMLDNKIIGLANIKHYLNDYLRKKVGILDYQLLKIIEDKV